MKTIFQYLCAGVLAVVYTVSMAGFSVQYCRCAHDRPTASSLGACHGCEGCRLPADERRPGACCGHEQPADDADGRCGHSPAQPYQDSPAADDADGRCCPTVVRLLQIDQNIVPSFSKIASPFFTLCPLSQPAFTEVYGVAASVASGLVHAPPLLHCDTSARLAFASQWRL
ncbi:MAG: hypothetical protein LBF90_01475 [Prevotellaceae bacterium]|jgi:hypothetical protein|nr:hypothetical protein [Prevotellaceae bacterium]